MTFTDDDDNEETLTSVATEAVAAAASTNTAPTGAPTISGTPQVGQTLTASTSDIADEDGLENVSYNYQWVADDVNIAWATGSGYTLVDDDAGKTIKVRVSFTDDEGNAETLTSAATTAVAAGVTSVVAPVWSMEMEVVDYGDGDVGAAIADRFSNDRGSLTVVWLWYSTRNRELHLAFTGPVADAEELRLQIDNVSLAFPEGSSGAPNFTFRNVDISWTDGQVVAVSIFR